jgi:hypothetical protein
MLEEIKTRLTEIFFKGRTFLDGKETGIEIEYIPKSVMKIKGLRPDLPRYVELWPDKIKASEDGKNWYELELETGLHILYILDPRVLLTEKACKLLEIRRNVDEDEFIVEYDLEILSKERMIYLPPDVLKWMEEQGERKRPAKILVTNARITKMIQKELPPSKQELAILFEY